MSSKPYRGHKGDWNRDEGSVPGHPTKHPKLNTHSQVHTSFDARPWSADRGSNTKPDRIHMADSNRFKHVEGEEVNGTDGHDPRPEHFHKNSGLEGRGHQLVRRGGSVIKGMNRGL